MALIANIKGPQGAKGDTGSPGAPGIPTTVSDTTTVHQILNGYNLSAETIGLTATITFVE